MSDDSNVEVLEPVESEVQQEEPKEKDSEINDEFGIAESLESSDSSDDDNADDDSDDEGDEDTSALSEEQRNFKRAARKTERRLRRENKELLESNRNISHQLNEFRQLFSTTYQPAIADSQQNQPAQSGSETMEQVALRVLQQQQQKAQEQTQVANVVNQFKQKVTEGTDRYKDFYEKVQKANLPTEVLEFSVYVPDTAAFLYSLANNKTGVLERIKNLPSVHDKRVELSRYSHSLEAIKNAPKKAITKAPAPLSESRTSNNSSILNKPFDQLTPSEMRENWRKNRR